MAVLSRPLGVLAKETEDLRLLPDSANDTRERRFMARSDSEGEMESAERVDRRLSDEPNVRRCLLASSPPEGESSTSLVSDGLSSSEEATDAAELRTALERPTELRTAELCVELRAVEEGVKDVSAAELRVELRAAEDGVTDAEARDFAEDMMLRSVDAGVRLASLMLLSTTLCSLSSSTCVSALASMVWSSAKESAVEERCERMELSVTAEPAFELAKLRRVLCSSAIQNSFSFSRPCASRGMSFFMRTPVRRPLRTISSTEASATCSSSSASAAHCFSTGTGSTAATTRLRNSIGRSVTTRPVPWRTGVGRFSPPICVREKQRQDRGKRVGPVHQHAGAGAGAGARAGATVSRDGRRRQRASFSAQHSRPVTAEDKLHKLCTTPYHILSQQADRGAHAATA